MTASEKQHNEDALRISHKISGYAFALIGILCLIAAGALVGFNGRPQQVVGNTAATPPAPKTVTVAMHDPGCHWFQVGSSFQKSLSVSGPVSLRNSDEAALKIVGPGGVKTDAVGQQVSLAPGSYTITMVGQAPDDNTLHLAVASA